MWLGPGPARGYNEELHAKAAHYFTYDYSVGFLGGWGAHPLDVAQWGLGADHTSPVEIRRLRLHSERRTLHSHSELDRQG